MTFKPPLKISILAAVSNTGPASSAEIMDALHPQYGRERQFNLHSISNHLLSLNAVGLIRDSGVSLKSDGSLEIKYVATEQGQKRLAACMP